MDKQRVIEIAHEIARRNEEKLGHKNPHHVRLYGMPDVRMIKLIDGGINEFVAAILLEAAEVCDKISDSYSKSSDGMWPELKAIGAVECGWKLEEIAKELTQ